jgi:hypothetical protein
MSLYSIASPRQGASPLEVRWENRLQPGWNWVRQAFLSSVARPQRARVAALLKESDSRGRGLRTWLRLIEAQEQVVLPLFPAELVQVYLDDDEAMPLHDCSGCGVAVPVRPDWPGHEGEPQRVYFPRCPCCGERTGLYASWSRSPAAPAPAQPAVAVEM